MATNLQRIIAIWCLFTLSTLAFPWNMPGLGLRQRDDAFYNPWGNYATVTVTTTRIIPR